MKYDAQMAILQDYFSMGVEDYPWQVVDSPASAARLEAEFSRETADPHPLQYVVKAVALAECGQNGEALFAAQYQGGEYFVIVALTGGPSPDGNLSAFTLFENFGSVLEHIRTEFPFADF